MKKLSSLSAFSFLLAISFHVTADPNSLTRKNYYDRNDRLVGQWLSEGFGIGYRYDGNGNLTRKVLLEEDINEDGVPDIFQFIAGIPLDVPMDRFADSDGDGWTDWQEVMSQSGAFSKGERPSLAGAAGSDMDVIEVDTELPVTSISTNFKPERLLMASGNVDGRAGDEIFIGAMGDTGGHENFLYIFQEFAGQWRLHKLSVGDSGVTSLAVGDAGSGQTCLYVGLSNPVSLGAILKVNFQNGTWVSHPIAGSMSEAAHVIGVREGESLVASLKSSFDDPEGQVSRLWAEDDEWKMQLFDDTAGPIAGAAVIKTDLGAYNSPGALIRRMDDGIHIINQPDEKHLNQGLAAWYPFDGNAYDTTDYMRDGVVTGAVLAENRHGDPNTAYSLNGSSSIVINDGGQLSFDASKEDYTVCVWVKPQGSGTVIRDNTASGYEGYSYRIYISPDDNKIHAELVNFAQNGVLSGDSVVTNGQWYHIAFRVKNKIASLFIDGQLQSQKLLLDYSTKNTGNVSIGNGFTGSIDDVRIYSRALRLTEIQWISETAPLNTVIPEDIFTNHVLHNSEYFEFFTIEEEVSLQIAQPQYHYVDDSYPTVLPPSEYDWASLHTSIQDAINAASDGDIIIVNEGTYAPITINKELTIQSLTNNPEKTIIDGQNTQRCVAIYAHTILKGMKIINGRLYTQYQSGKKGAGVYAEAPVVIDNCVIEQCSIHALVEYSQHAHGAGLFLNQAIIKNSVIKNNVIYSYRLKRILYASGGGVYILSGEIVDSIISDNVIEGHSNTSDNFFYGGGVYSNSRNNVILRNSEISNNYLNASAAYRTTPTRGGGLHGVTAINCNIYDNTARSHSWNQATKSYGGGAYDSLLVNCLINNNKVIADCSHWTNRSAWAMGAGVYSSILNNCTVINNMASGLAERSLYVYGAIASSIANNSIIYKNHASIHDSAWASRDTVNGAGAADDNSTLTNCLIYDNTCSQVPGYVTYPNCSIGCTVINTVYAEPKFVDFSAGNFRLQSDSPCIDAGQNMFVTEDVDLDGNHRVWNNIVDIGAYEYGSQPFILPPDEDDQLDYHYVSPDGQAPSHRIWKSVHTQIQSAVNAAADGDVIIVNDGTYAPITINKELTIQSINGPEVTVVDGQNTQRCVTMNEQSTLIGLTIYRGYVSQHSYILDDGQGGSIYYYEGGGVFIGDKGGHIKDCIIDSCKVYCSGAWSTSGQGGGIFAKKGFIDNTIIRNNRIECYYTTIIARSASGWGAGIYINNGVIDNCTIDNNRVHLSRGGSVTGRGAGIGGSTGGSVSINKTIVKNNTIYLNSNSSTAHGRGAGTSLGTVTDGLIFGNQITSYADGHATAQGSGAYNAQLINCVVSKNHIQLSSFNGRERARGALNGCHLRNSIVYRNTLAGSWYYDAFSGLYSGSAYNCLVYGNNQNEFYNCSVLNLIQAEPLFVNFNNNDFRLQSNSPCIDAGSNLYVTTDTDLDGNQRIWNEIVDIGAYEYGAPPYTDSSGDSGYTETNVKTFLYYSRTYDNDLSGDNSVGDAFVSTAYELTETGYVKLHTQTIPVQKGVTNQQHSTAIANLNRNIHPQLFSAESDGSVYVGQPLLYTSELTGINRHLLSNYYSGYEWDGLTGISNQHGTEWLVGLLRKGCDSRQFRLVMWDSIPDSEELDAVPGEIQTAPEAQLLPEFSEGGHIARLQVEISDAEGNRSAPVVQYRLGQDSPWMNATIVTANGQLYDGSHLDALPTGSVHTLFWDSFSDLGENFTGTVELRMNATDVSLTGNWSSIFQYYVNTSNKTGVPVIQIGQTPDWVDSLVESITLSGYCNGYVTGNLRAINHRNDQAVTFSSLPNWQSPPIPLEEGQNIITVYAQNADGFVVSDSIVVNRRRDKMPVLEVDPVESPVNVRFISLTGVSRNLQGEILLENLTNGDSVSFSAEEIWQSPLIELRLGHNTIKASAQNVYGYLNVDHINIVADNSILYVDANSPNDPGIGTEEYPFRRIEDAIDFAYSGDTIFVKAGSYLVDYLVIQDKDLTIIGQGSPSNNWNTTITTYADGWMPVIKIIDSNMKLQGLNITGNVLLSEHNFGSGISCVSQEGQEFDVEILNCRIEGNTLVITEGDNTAFGAGVYGDSNAKLTILESAIENNKIEKWGENWHSDDIKGAGIYSDHSYIRIIENKISSNQIVVPNQWIEYAAGHYYGAGIYINGGEIIQNEISNNIIDITVANYLGGTITGYGGGLYSAGPTLVKDNRISENAVKMIQNAYSDWDGMDAICLGGGLHVKDSIVLGNLMINNSLHARGGDGFRDYLYWFESKGGDATTRGAGVYSNNTILINNTIYGNSLSATPGMGWYMYDDCWWDEEWDELWCDWYEDEWPGEAITQGAGVYRAGETVELTNNIVWGNTPNQVFGTVTAFYNNVQGGLEGTGSIDTDPLFVDPANNDFRLKSEYGRWSPSLQSWVFDDVTSPCIDAGNPSDDGWKNEPWPHGKRINMGAYGGTAQASMSASAEGLLADINRDGRVDLSDFALLASNWSGQNSYKIPHGSITVDGDLSDWASIANWIPLNTVYSGQPDDIEYARFALAWNENTNKIYVAVVIRDLDHVFRDDYLNWSASDRLEIYCQGNPVGGTGYSGVYDIAQHYYIAPGMTKSWATWALGEEIQSDAELEYAVAVVGDMIVYEAAVTVFDYYGGFSGGQSEITDLQDGSIIGFDIVALTRNQETVGMLSENNLTGKSNNAGHFAKYTLIQSSQKPTSLPNKADITMDGTVGLLDFLLFAEQWLGGD